MKKYTVVIEETIVEEFQVVAQTEKEALEIAHKKYKNNEFVLEHGEVQYVQMAVVKPQKEKIIWMEV